MGGGGMRATWVNVEFFIETVNYNFTKHCFSAKKGSLTPLFFEVINIISIDSEVV